MLASMMLTARPIHRATPSQIAYLCALTGLRFAYTSTVPVMVAVRIMIAYLPNGNHPTMGVPWIHA